MKKKGYGVNGVYNQDLNGNVIIEAQSITPEPFLNRYINVFDKSYNRFIYDDSCRMLFKLDSGDQVLVLE